jgi:hypothetical protein
MRYVSGRYTPLCGRVQLIKLFRLSIFEPYFTNIAATLLESADGIIETARLTDRFDSLNERF